MSRLQVGKTKIKFVEDGKKKSRPLTYSDCSPDIEGWIDASKFLPISFDLLKMRTDKKSYNGWYDGEDFVGGFMPKESTVIYWKHQRELGPGIANGS